MKIKTSNNISESQVESALVANLSYLKDILRLSYDLKLIARQLRMKSGEQRLDLLLSGGKNLYLIELKITPYSEEHLIQILSYKEELRELQLIGSLIDAEILLYLFVTEANNVQIELSSKKNVNVIIFEPLDILKSYYQNLAALTPFLNIRPNDYGVFNIGLINRTLAELANGAIEQEIIASKINLSKGSVHNHLRLGIDFDLVRIRNKKYFLTDRGDEYVHNYNKNAPLEILSEKQIEILKQLVAKDPFYSSSVFGVYSIIESAFMLSRNSYPIQLQDLRKTFKTIAGKDNEWQAEKSLNTATYTFLNFAIDLELLGKIGQQIVITPAGFRFILMLQLHKSIKMIEGFWSRLIQSILP